jgi:hypothetical protein
MNTLIIKTIAIGAAITTMTGLSIQADEPQLQLHGKTVLICPIMLGKPSDDDDAWKYAISMAKGLGIMLERRGMLPSISPHCPESIRVEENLAEVAKQLHALRDQWKMETDYTLFARFEGKQAGQEFLARARAVMTDATGKIVWSQDPEEFSKGGNMWPIALYMELGRTLTAVSDLKESVEKTDPGPLETKLRQKHETDRKTME